MRAQLSPAPQHMGGPRSWLYCGSFVGEKWLGVRVGLASGPEHL